ncbi:MAG: glycosyltransferase [Lachnospiraceae bacterium]
MKITFVSNYINHHQIPVSNELFRQLGEDYCFIQTEPIEAERLQMGWEDQTGKLSYLKCYYDEPEVCKKLIMESDAVIFGGTDEESYIQDRLKAGKLTIRYSERLYKTGQWKAVSPRGLNKKYQDHTRYRKSPVYLLCAGGYVPCDFHIVHAYPEKMLKWGYFPATMELDIDEVWERKNRKAMKPGESASKEGVMTLLWAGRFIDWKHPELPIFLAQQLKQKGYKFHLTMVGGGDMEQEICGMVQKKQLEDCVELAGYLSPEQVREKMLDSQIYLFTSDYQEGWGAVLNEAMNSGCAVVASHAIGAVPFLVQHGKNGLIFESGNQKDFCNQVEKLLQKQKEAENLGKEAYQTITETWNAEKAADRLLTTIKNLQLQEELSFYAEGPCSRAEVVSERRMLYKLKNHNA